MSEVTENSELRIDKLFESSAIPGMSGGPRISKTFFELQVSGRSFESESSVPIVRDRQLQTLPRGIQQTIQFREYVKCEISIDQLLDKFFVKCFSRTLLLRALAALASESNFRMTVKQSSQNAVLSLARTAHETLSGIRKETEIILGSWVSEGFERTFTIQKEQQASSFSITKITKWNAVTDGISKIMNKPTASHGHYQNFWKIGTPAGFTAAFWEAEVNFDVTFKTASLEFVMANILPVVPLACQAQEVVQGTFSGGDPGLVHEDRREGHE
ncbi:hypothetical protein BU15DRAFT_64951 [Melanogaster broomeanus]|nr:hypothetical protein BU15DRAFT_64951 [Melanogaster broomeanus]